MGLNEAARVPKVLTINLDQGYLIIIRIIILNIVIIYKLVMFRPVFKKKIKHFSLYAISSYTINKMANFYVFQRTRF